MKIIKADLKIYKNGRSSAWKKGMLHVPKEDMEILGWEQQEFIIAMVKPGETVDAEELARQLNEYNKLICMEKEIKKIKEERF